MSSVAVLTDFIITVSYIAMTSISRAFQTYLTDFMLLKSFPSPVDVLVFESFAEFQTSIKMLLVTSGRTNLLRLGVVQLTIFLE